MAAKYYIYKNIRTGLFSVRHRGKVITHVNGLCVGPVEFRVNERGRQEVINTGVKNVHAYVVCDTLSVDTMFDVSAFKEVRYNPFKSGSFRLNGRPINKARAVYFRDGKAYAHK